MGRVKRKAYIIGTLAVILALNAPQGLGAYCKVVNSARNFQRYYRDLQQGSNTLNPVERIVFSLVLANSKHHEQTAQSAEPAGRT